MKGLALLGLGVAACGGAAASPPAAAPQPAAAADVAGLAVAHPEVELRDAKSAVVGGKTVTMDGEAEGLAWPALRTATGRKVGDHAPLVLGVGRDVPVGAVMRAVWTLRDADLRVQTPDAGGAVHVLDLAPKPDVRTTGGCHLAVFVGANGDLRIAAPGGPRDLPGPDAGGSLARALADERTRCAIRYVGFGAEKPDAPWSAVFDVAWAVDRAKSAGDARYVLAEPVHAAGR